MNKLLLCCMIFVTSACVSIPKETVTLSEVIGERIVATQIAHENLILDYFQKSRNEIDRFLQEQWIPEFLETYVEDVKIMDLLNEVKVLSDDDENKIMESLNQNESFTGSQLVNIIHAVNNGLGDSEKGAIILDFAQNAIEQINLQRTEMIDIISEREKVVLKEVRANYIELIALQNVLTSHIRSTHKVVEKQNEILNRINLLDSRDKIIDEAIKVNESYSKILNEGKSALELATKFTKQTNQK